jgi:hypothetical protein
MTTTPQLISCPHCGAQNYAASPMCHACGNALPASVAGGPRILTGDVMPGSTAGAKMQGDDYRKKSRKATNTLLVVAILNLAVGALFFFVMNNRSVANLDQDAMLLLAGGSMVFGAIFFGLYFWARTSPFIPSLIGLIIYSLATIAMVGMNASSGRSNVPWLNIAIIIFLAQGMSAAKKYENLKRQYGFQ